MKRLEQSDSQRGGRARQGGRELVSVGTVLPCGNGKGMEMGGAGHCMTVQTYLMLSNFVNYTFKTENVMICISLQ